MFGEEEVYAIKADVALDIISVQIPLRTGTLTAFLHFV
jgi:hypothetical protein